MENNIENKWRKIFGGFGNRMSNEIAELMYEYNNIQITRDNRNTIFEIKVMNHIINIKIGEAYPFSFPIVNVDDKSIVKFNIVTSKRMTDILELNNLCFCGETILKNNSWTPCTKIVTVVNQIYKTIYIKKRMYFYIIIEQIKRKYLNPNIDLFTYIFGDCKYNIRYPFIYAG